MAVIINGTTGISGVDGSAGTPAVQGTDTNTGVFYPAADTVGVSTGGSERLRVDSSGNVGIGTSSPASRLHVSDAGAVADNCFNVSTPANDNVLLGANLVVDVAGTYTKPATSLSGAGILFEGINSLNGHGTISFLSAPDTNTGSATPLERMRIDSSGNVGIGLTPSYRLSVLDSAAGARVVDIQNTASTGNPIMQYSTMTVTGTTSNYFFVGRANASDRVYIYGSGNIVNVNNSYGALSDVKLKENIIDATPKLADLMRVKVRNYNLIGETQKQIGVVAQELEQVFPSMVDETIDRDAEGNELETTTKSVKYSVFVPMLIKAIQELKALVDTQASIITQLQADIATLKGQA